MTKRILFLTGTRADFGKLKPLMRAVADDPRFEHDIFVTGMHTLRQYGYTVNEVHKAGFKNVHVYMNQHAGDHMEMALASTVMGLSRYVHETAPDMLVVHGDRVEALAGAIVGALCNTLVAHIEGGERSGTVDEVIRHSVSKLSHLHFVANEDARTRLIQMGEIPDSVFVIGSPDIDAMMSSRLPTLAQTRERYGIGFEDFGILLYHPVTTDVENVPRYAKVLVDAVLASEQSYVVIYPNNDNGAQAIFAEYARLKDHPRFRTFPSIQFESFLTLMKASRFILGNSSAGIREAPVYGKYTINVGDRQARRLRCPSILDVPHDLDAILAAIRHASTAPPPPPVFAFGTGDSTQRFMQTLGGEAVWSTPRQKVFRDVELVRAGEHAAQAEPASE